MKISKVLSHTFTALVYSWVGLQIFSFGAQVEKVEQNTVAASLESRWKSLKEKNLIQGSILIQKGSEVIFADGDLSKAYPIASISKPVTAMVYLQKSKQGLNLQSPVCQWLKNFCVEGLKTITLQNLLDHTSGFGRDLSLFSFLKRSLDSEWKLQDIDTLILSADDLDSKPGATFQYSNFGFLVLSRVLEVMDEKSYSKIIDERSELGKGPVAIQKSEEISSYVLIPNTSQKISINLKSSLSKAAGAGGLKSSAADLMQWLDNEKENLEPLFGTDTKDNYKMGWVRSRSQSYQAYWHNGASPGFYSLVAVIPASDLKVVILTDNYKFIKQWSEWAEAFEQYFY